MHVSWILYVKLSCAHYSNFSLLISSGLKSIRLLSPYCTGIASCFLLNSFACIFSSTDPLHSGMSQGTVLRRLLFAPSLGGQPGLSQSFQYQRCARDSQTYFISPLNSRFIYVTAYLTCLLINISSSTYPNGIIDVPLIYPSNSFSILINGTPSFQLLQRSWSHLAPLPASSHPKYNPLDNALGSTSKYTGVYSLTTSYYLYCCHSGQN